MGGGLAEEVALKEMREWIIRKSKKIVFKEDPGQGSKGGNEVWVAARRLGGWSQNPTLASEVFHSLGLHALPPHALWFGYSGLFPVLQTHEACSYLKVFALTPLFTRMSFYQRASCALSPFGILIKYHFVTFSFLGFLSSIDITTYGFVPCLSPTGTMKF